MQSLQRYLERQHINLGGKDPENPRLVGLTALAKLP